MRVVAGSLCALALLAGVAALPRAQAQLPPEARMQVLILQADNAKQKGDNAAALKLFAEMDRLANVARPAETYFEEAALSGQAQDHARAMKALEGYFRAANTSHPDYQKAVLMYATAEERKRDADAVAAAQAAFAAARAGRPVAERAFQDVLADGTEGPVMVALPAGSFMMGSPASEAGHSDDEGPQRRVSVAAFAAGKFEVTWAEWDRCVAAGSCASLKADGFGGGSRPVTNVSWNEAVSYTKWLSSKTGQTYRLLSESEWEYSARAGTTTPFSFGATISPSQANYDGNFTYGNGSSGEYRQKTTPVGTFAANAFGLHDMHGNVWEWVQDCYAENYSSGQSSNGSALQSGSCSKRVGRGGSWIDVPRNLRSASRDRGGPAIRDFNLGFRVARTL